MTSKSEAAKKKFEADYKSGKMKVNSGEVISPAKIVGKAAAMVAKPILKVAAKKAVKQNKKIVEKVAKMQEKTKTAKIASNSVKVKPADSYKKSISNAKSNSETAIRGNSGMAKRDAREIEMENMKARNSKSLTKVISSKNGVTVLKPVRNGTSPRKPLK